MLVEGTEIHDRRRGDTFQKMRYSVPLIGCSFTHPGPTSQEGESDHPLAGVVEAFAKYLHSRGVDSMAVDSFKHKALPMPQGYRRSDRETLFVKLMEEKLIMSAGSRVKKAQDAHATAFAYADHPAIRLCDF